jgi:hypothetical protein
MLPASLHAATITRPCATPRTLGSVVLVERVSRASRKHSRSMMIGHYPVTTTRWFSRARYLEPLREENNDLVDVSVFTAERSWLTSGCNSCPDVKHGSSLQLRVVVPARVQQRQPTGSGERARAGWMSRSPAKRSGSCEAGRPKLLRRASAERRRISFFGH